MSLSVTSLGQRELRKWCKDLEHTLINLERWTKWIDFWYRQIYLMKQSASRSEPSKRILYEWLQLRKNMNREATLWKKLTCTTLQILQTYTDKSKARSKSLSPILRIQKDNNSVFDVIQTIEEMSMWLHRAIVSTEHIASRCHCQRRDLTPKLKKKYKKK